MISIFNGKFFKIETNIPSPNILRMCSHLGLKVNFEISNKDIDESSEATETSESRRWLLHEDMIHRSLSNMNLMW